MHTDVVFVVVQVVVTVFGQHLFPSPPCSLAGTLTVSLLRGKRGSSTAVARLNHTEAPRPQRRCEENMVAAQKSLMDVSQSSDRISERYAANELQLPLANESRDISRPPVEERSECEKGDSGAKIEIKRRQGRERWRERRRKGIMGKTPLQ